MSDTRWMVVRSKDRATLAALLPADWRIVFDATPTPDGQQDFVVECHDDGVDTLERVQRRLSMHDMFGREFRERDAAFESASAAMN